MATQWWLLGLVMLGCRADESAPSAPRPEPSTPAASAASAATTGTALAAPPQADIKKPSPPPPTGSSKGTYKPGTKVWSDDWTSP
jgi:hypothetical protein